MTYPAKTGFLDLQGTQFFYKEAGEGVPLLLLHAGVADSRMWDAQVQTFATTYRVIRCDLRGFGESSLPKGAFAHHEDVAALFDTLAIQSAWIIGASFGGRVAVDFCLAYPDRVQGLVLVAPLIGGYEPGEQILQFGVHEDALLEAGDLDGATELNLRMWVDGPFRTPDQVSTAVRTHVAEMQRHAFAIPTPENVSLRRLDPPALARLHEIRVPTLIISGALDVPEVVAHTEVLAREIANADRIIMPGTAHLPSLEAPQMFNKLVMKFINGQLS